jgi:CBS domain-containing protein
MRVRELLRDKAAAVTIRTGTPLHVAARLLMERRIGGVPVLDDRESLVGFLSERDIVRALDRGGDNATQLPVDRFMQRPAPVCGMDDEVRQLMGSMTAERHRHVVVMDAGRIAGVISVGDLVKHRVQQLELEAGVLRDYVAAQRASS